MCYYLYELYTYAYLMASKTTTVHSPFGKAKLIENEIALLCKNNQFVSAFFLKFLFLEQFLEVLVSLIYLQMNREQSTKLVELARDEMRDSTFGHKVMHLQKLNKKFKLGIREDLFRSLQKISTFRNRTVHRLLHADMEMNQLNRESKKWITEIDQLSDRMFREYLKVA